MIHKTSINPCQISNIVLGPFTHKEGIICIKQIGNQIVSVWDFNPLEYPLLANCLHGNVKSFYCNNEEKYGLRAHPPNTFLHYKLIRWRAIG